MSNTIPTQPVAGSNVLFSPVTPPSASLHRSLIGAQTCGLQTRRFALGGEG